MTTSNLRSKTYMDIFPDDEMIDAFGHLTPSLSERNAHFFDKWMEWRSHRMKIKTSVRVKATTFENRIKETCRSIGLREFWDFQCRQGEIRFAQPDYMAMFRLKWDSNG